MKHIKLPKNYLSIAIFCILLLFALIGAVWQPFDITKINISNRFMPPSLAHLMGTDYLGRDILSLLLYGLGQSYLIAILGIIPTAIIGVVLGYFASQQNFIAKIITLSADFIFAFPVIITAIFFAAHFGASKNVAIIAIALFAMPVLIKVTRSQLFAIKSSHFIEAAYALGITEYHLFFRHYWPNIRQAIYVQISILFTIAILTEAALSYLGFSGKPDDISLGKMLFDAQNFVHLAPHMIIFPGAFFVLIIVNINFLIDYYNDEKPIIELRF